MNKKNKLSCPHCGNQELKIVNMPKKELNLSIFLASFCALSIIVLIFAITALDDYEVAQNIDEVFENIKSYAIALGAIFTSITIFVITVGFMLCSSQRKNELYYICPNCTRYDTVSSLIEPNKEQDLED